MSLHLDRLCVRAPDGRALFAPLSLRLAPGAVGCVMGPSGVGKSTLLNAVGGHLPRTFRADGRVLVDGCDVMPLPAERRRIGVMFQQAVMFPHLSVAGNLAFGLCPSVRGRAARRRAVEDALERAGLAGFGPRDPATLSGGQQARVALLRTLLARPRAVLLDEPFSGLDAERRQDIRRFVFDSIRTAGIAALLVTHDAEDAEAAGGAVTRLG
ncbi:ATP-binding cassette domain-containing protein [Falsirhodobacter algicola]|uniref:ATP-binding cassette domain-containing protein n=1 Tax=Falsirhodobacter algicola TaxID=2692330 RepID=A0A8J8MUP7_9RHOB|nr:ATP-binding cassette domain-containing protein [Falsirhodobacter algicola]QUS37025.1 ATP-binding cassette domain-containing protein [Falsirhodobacter algicola]